VKLSMLTQTIPDALVVPASSILTAPDGSTSVMLVGADNRAHQAAVRLGVKQGDDRQVVGGLRAGEKVVTVGAYGLPEKVKVNVEKSQEAVQQPAKPDAGKESDEDEK
jgi:multidrug efflux pump subunit AcrA (membrane-fusion protein)